MGLTIGLVGCGRWGTVHLRTLQDLKSTGHVQRVVVCDIDADKLARIQADATYASLNQMLENEQLDGVAIVTPPNTHVDLAQEALMHSLPVLVEKPLAVDHEVANNFLNSLQENTVLVVGYILRTITPSNISTRPASKTCWARFVRSTISDKLFESAQSVPNRYRPWEFTPRPYRLAADQPLMSGEVVNKSTTADTASVNLVFLRATRLV